MPKELASTDNLLHCMVVLCMYVCSGGTTCVWAPVRETHLGPHKMMTYVGRSGGILRQKIFEFRVSEMAFSAF